MMNETRYRQLHEHFVQASKLVADARGAFVARLRAADAELGDELAALLGNLGGDDDVDDPTPALFALMGTGSQHGARTQLAALAGTVGLGALPSRIDGFRLIRPLGQGGMGIVFEAEQDAPRRRVALKLMQPSLGTERLRRFELEAAVLGRLHHPNIAQIHASGTWRGPLGEQPYFAMELIDGTDLRTHAERAQLDLTQRLELFAQVVDGVQHAHERGVVHRDLKPENVLVDRHGVAKVLDFGVARAADSSVELTSMATRDGEVLGTLSYMAPEQLAGNSAAVTARSDVYSLGVMLYELLGKRLPHEVAGLPVAAAIAVLTSQPPAPLARFDVRLRGDLATIVGKAMEPDPARRYATAAELAADIRRHVEHLPIHARPASMTYRLTTMLRRNRAMATGLGIAFAALVVGFGGMAWQAHTAAIERDVARRQGYAASVMGAGDAMARAEFATARSFLDAAPASLRGWEWRVLMAQLDSSVAVDASSLALPAIWDLDVWPVAGGRRYWQLLRATDALKRHNGPEAPGFARLWQRDPGQWLAELPRQGAWTPSSDGERLFCVTTDGETPARFRVATFAADSGAGLGETLVEAPESESLGRLYREACCSPDGASCWFAIAGGVARADLRGIAPTRTCTVLDLDNGLSRPAFRLDGTAVAWASQDDGRVFVFDAQSLAVLATLSGHTNLVKRLAFSPDGMLLASGSGDQTVRVWSLAADAPACQRVLPHPLAVESVAFSPNGRLLVTGCIDRMLRVFRVADGQLLGTFGSNKLLSVGARFLDDRTILGVESDGSVRYWDIEAVATNLWRGHGAPVERLALVPRLGLVVSAGVEGFRGLRGGLKFWDMASGDLVAECLGETTVAERLCLEREGTTLHLMQRNVADPAKQGFGRIDLRSGAWSLKPWAFRGLSAALSPSADTLAITTAETPRLHTVDLATGQPGLQGGVPAQFHLPMHWSRDGSWLLAGMPGSEAEGLVLVDATSLAEVRRFSSPAPLAFAVGADERHLAVAGKDSVIRLFDIATGERLAELRGHDLDVFALAFSPDGTRLASSGHDRAIRLWDLGTFEPVARLSGHEDTVMALVWDGNERLVSCGHDDTVRIWETAPVRTRVAARAARREALARVEPRVEALFAELGDGARVFERIAADPALGDLDRKVAHQVALRIGLAKAAAK